MLKQSLMYVLLSLMFSQGARALPAASPEWMEFSLKVKTVFSEIYQNSIAESVFVRIKPGGFLPPIQSFSRPVQANLEADTRKIRDEIFKNLGVDLSSKSTLKMKSGAFKAGRAQDLPAWNLEYQSSGETQSLVTCIVVVKAPEKLKVVYVQAFTTSLRNCSESLVDLARSGDLLR